MPTYALLGATGSTGSAILRHLISSPLENFTLNILVRSRSKLQTAFPNLENNSDFKVNIVEGTPSDKDAIKTCLEDVDVIMACIGSNYSSPGMSLIYDTALSIVDTLKVHRDTKGSGYITPTVVQLSSASLNPFLKASMPWIVSTMAAFCFRYVYEDLDRACKLFTSSATSSPGLLEFISIEPPSIHDPDGTTPTGYELIVDEGTQETSLSYADLGVAFCEVAERRGEFRGKAVGVSATGHVNQTLGMTLGYVLSGAKGRIFG